MAVPGLSGSAGGVSSNFQPLSKEDLNITSIKEKFNYPYDVSYFINNTCNLKCKHCYVAYKNDKNALNLSEWESVFDQLINMGALTFGNVGKEPTLNWASTKHLLKYFKEKRDLIPKIRYGLVTNGTLLDKLKIADMANNFPNYIDISLDGDENTHDYIRGKGAFAKLINNLKMISKTPLISKVFIIYTLNKATINAISEVMKTITNVGIKNILFSPYVTVKSDVLYLPDNYICSFFQQVMEGEIIDYDKYNNLTIYLKNDYSTTLGIMNDLVKTKIIDLENLFIDDYGVIFNKYNLGNENTVLFNYVPFENSYKQTLRISHDGYVGNCYDMFFENYPERTIGNVREKNIAEILEDSRVIEEEYVGCNVR